MPQTKHAQVAQAAQEHITLDTLPLHAKARIVHVEGEASLRQHLLDMGLVPGAVIEPIKRAPFGDPIEFRIRNYQLTLRIAEVSLVHVTQILEDELSEDHKPLYSVQQASKVQALSHPKLGESRGLGTYKKIATTHDDKPLTFVLVGNQNSGKTTLFNQLTGARQRVGNFPGVTIEYREATLKGAYDTIIDLPGLYSLSPYSNEEVIARSYIFENNPSAIINVVDATNIERNLYLTMQLMELGIPVVVALNMMDEVQKNSVTININLIEDLLGVPVVPISALHGEGVAELVDHAKYIARHNIVPRVQDFCSRDDFGGAVHTCIHSVMQIIESSAISAHLPVRFCATKLVEKDALVAQALKLTSDEIQAIEHLVTHMEQQRALDRAAAIADMRYAYIADIVHKAYRMPSQSKEAVRSRMIDTFLTGKFTAIPIFILIMSFIFLFTFNIAGPFFQDVLQIGIDAVSAQISQALEHAEFHPVVQAFVVDGLINGVGSVLVFFPIIVLMFFFLSLLQDTGYMARVAFFMDRIFRKLGLSGASIVPMIMGFGCTVPAIMAARTLPSQRDRKFTILLTPFMSCATKLVIYGFVASVLFPKRSGFVIVSLYLLGIAVAVAISIVLSKTAFKGQAVPFVMELPNYRMPSLKSLFILVWEKAKGFITQAFSIIVIATIVIWFLQSFTPQFMFTQAPEESMLAYISGWLSPLFAPLGFGDWRFVTALISGFLAKETVVSTLSVLFGSTAVLAGAISAPATLAFLVFSLLYTPCVAAVGAVKKELGIKWALIIVLSQTVIAWLFSWLTYMVFRLFM